MLSGTRESLLRRWASWGPPAIVGVAISLFVFENRTVVPPVDDAYIFYRYAKHFVAGDGLVFNVGERVEGFSSPLWLLFIAAGVAAGADAVALGHWLGVACGALLLWLTYVYASLGLAARQRWLAAVASVLLFLSPAFAIWTVSGLETPLFAAAIVATLIAESRSRPGLAVLGCVVTAMIRSEGILLAGVVFVFLLKKAERRARVFALLAGYAACLAILTAFRLVYFGAILPNTFYAKVGGTIAGWGAFYIGRFFVQTLLPMLWPIRYGVRERYLMPGLCWALTMLVFVAGVGGDAFDHNRFFVPVLPVLCALTACGALRAFRGDSVSARFAVSSVAVCALWFAAGTIAGFCALLSAALTSSLWGGARMRRVAVAAFAVLSVGGSIFVSRAVKPLSYGATGTKVFDVAMVSIPISTRWVELSKNRQMWHFSDELARSAAARLDARGPADKLVASVGIGALGYYSQARVLDLLGLVDPVIARSGPPPQALREFAFPGHQRTNAPYVLSRNPDYIMIPERSTESHHLPAVLALWQESNFWRHYHWDESLSGYVRNRRSRRPRR